MDSIVLQLGEGGKPEVERALCASGGHAATAIRIPGCAAGYRIPVDVHSGGIIPFSVPRAIVVLRPFRRSATVSEEDREPSGREELIERARRRDSQAWTEIYDHFAGPIFGWFFSQLHHRELSEDMTGEVFVEAMKAAERFHGSFADLRSWLFRIARNNLIDHVRRQKRATLEAIEDADPTQLNRAVPSEDPEEIALSNLDRQRVRKAVERLSPDQREVLLLRLNGGLSSPEMATIVGKTVGAVKALQHRALVSLAKALGDQER
jgi:RNA polymerase sigma-70 factor (ECF subfamily)